MRRSKRKQPFPAYISYNETQSSQQLDQSASVDVQYEIQQILQHRIRDSSHQECGAVQTSDKEIPLSQLKDDDLEYLVKWAGYDDLSWEPASNLRNAPQIVERYKQQNLPTRSNKKTKNELKDNDPVKGRECNIETSKPLKHFSFSKVFPSYKHVKMSEDDSQSPMQINQSTYLLSIINSQNEEAYLGDRQRLLLKRRKVQAKRERKLRTRKADGQILDNKKLEEIEREMGNFKEKKFTQGFDEFDSSQMPLDYCQKYQNEIEVCQPRNNMNMYKTAEYSRGPLKRLNQAEEIQVLEAKKAKKKVKLNELINKKDFPLETTGQKYMGFVDLDDYPLQSQPEIDKVDDWDNFQVTHYRDNLTQRIKEQIRSLEQDSLALQQIYLRPCVPVKLLAEQSAGLKVESCAKHEADVKYECLHQERKICSDCLVWRQKREELNRMYNQQLEIELNFDSLFAEQGVLEILNNLNPLFESKEPKYFHGQKLVDISENKLLCQLILKRLVKYPDVCNLMRLYSISKFVRIDSLWYAILKVKQYSRGSALDHFKYVPAEALALACRDSTVQFLTR